MQNQINLIEFKNNSTSQHGENGILLKMVEELGIKNGTAFEAGALDGILNSNINPFISVGWNILFVEYDKDGFKDLKKNMSSHKNVICLNRKVGKDNINEILKEQSIPEDLDIFSLDIDSNDYWVWKELEFKPKIVCIEYEGGFRGHKIYPYDEDGTLKRIPHNGASASALAIEKLAMEKGYQLVGITRPNLIFIRNDIPHNFMIFDANVSRLYHRDSDYNYTDAEWNKLYS